MQQSASSTPIEPELARYSRQILCDNMGLEAQRRLRDSRVVLVGCGALGTVLADTLVRGGLGHLRICDRDFIEKNNTRMIWLPIFPKPKPLPRSFDASTPTSPSNPSSPT